MQSTVASEDRSRIVIEPDGRGDIYSVLFADDKEVFSGGREGILQRWRVDDGHEVGKPIRAGAYILAAALSPDRKWLVCGLDASPRVRVWDVETHEQVLEMDDHTSYVYSVDISSDSTKFATGGFSKCVFISSMVTGKQLVGPLKHDNAVWAVRFSPSGDRIATATANRSFRIYDCDSGQRLLEIPCQFKPYLSSPLAWSADGRQLFTVLFNEAQCFDASSGSLLSTWFIPGDASKSPSSIALSRNQKFISVAANKSLSFWDASMHKQIGPVFQHAGNIWSMALSPNNEFIATGEEHGKITLRNLRDILPDSYIPADSTSAPSISPHPLDLPLITEISTATIASWMEGNLTRAEQLLTAEIDNTLVSSHHACALAHRALVRSRLKQWNMAIDDAKKSIEVQRSVVGHIAHAMARVGDRDNESAMRAFDLVFTDSLSVENNFLLLIKAIILFECGKHNDAISRIDDLIRIVDDKAIYIVIWAQLFLFLGGMSPTKGDLDRCVELLGRAREAIPFPKSPHLTVISLVFGWDFDGLAVAIQRHIEEWVTSFENNGDAAVQSENPGEAIVQYSTALSLNPSNPADILVKRSKARAVLTLWEDALKDADEAIKANPQSPWGYERRHAALHGLHRYDEAVGAINQMLSLMEQSLDDGTRQLAQKYVSPAQSEMAINNIVRDVVKVCPLVLIDVKSGRMCDGTERTNTFKSEPQFFELVSSMILELDDRCILRVVAKYFEYVMFSHVWEGKEPSFQDVKSVGSVWDLDSSPLNIKLRKFCEVVRGDGYRWAWSDTCCIDKTISTVLNQSLKMMYKWYEASAATFVFLADVDSLLGTGSLTDSIWMTRAWTSQELLAPMMIRFYDRNWQPYRGDARANHKESAEIMEELADAIGISRETITAFNPDNLSVREKLRLASTRNATVEEDIAYSLIGTFRSDIRPDYGEGYAAVGHLLEEIVARSGEVTVLSWAGKSSPYNSCLPATLAVYHQIPHASPAVEDAQMDMHVAALRRSLSQTDAVLIHDRITRLPPARFSNRRLYLPSIIFPVKRLVEQGLGGDQEMCYRARISGIGYLEFYTSDRLSVMEPRKLILVHPWIQDLRDALDGFTWGSASDDESESDSDESQAVSAPTSSSRPAPSASMDHYTRALRLIVRLQQPFHALLLEQQPRGEFKRVAVEHEITVPGLDSRVNFAKDIRTEVVEIL